MKLVIDSIVEFLQQYYMFISLGLAMVVFLLQLFLFLTKNRKFLVTVYDRIREWLPSVVNAAEGTALKGEAKLSFAVDLIKGYLGKAYPKLDPDKYTKVIVRMIEEILSTPQKKGD